MDKDQRIIRTALIVTLAIGTLNSAVVKKKGLPAMRFYIGTAIAFGVLSVVADMGDDAAEIAKPMAIAIMTTMLLGEGGGILTHFNAPVVEPPKKTAADKTKGAVQHGVKSGVQATTSATRVAVLPPLHNMQIPGIPVQH